MYYYKKRMNIYSRDFKREFSKKAQVTIFIILAVVLVAGVILFFIFRGSLGFGGVPAEFESVYNYYLECIDKETQNGVLIMGQQSGYIDKPDFSPGTDYMPFSSQLDFLGTGVPYWYYISGNGIVKEQVPTKEKMEEELNGFLEETMELCDFSKFRKEGFSISLKDAEVKSEIKRNRIEIDVSQQMVISNDESSWTSNKHSREVISNLGRFYELSTEIYDNFKETMFLENYGIDVLRLYAPVDGVEISCAPQIWSVEEVRNNITQALEANTPFVKVKGDYYTLDNEENKYFVQDIGENVDVNVNFMFSGNWPNKMQVWPEEDGLMRADPVGLQEGLGMLGFCYVPYHFVYDLGYPVLIQLYEGDEFFQFPVVVYINKNKPREPLDTSGLPNAVPELCQHKNTQINVNTYDINLDPIEAEIRYKCFDTNCRIGTTKIEGSFAKLSGKFPQCKNGYVVASAEGYETRKELFSTINPGSIDLFLDKKYDLDLEIEPYSSNDFAIITFSKEDGSSTTVAYPEQKKVSLSAGQYDIKAYVYSDSEITLEGSSEEKCVEVPKSGIFGFFGATEEKCFDLEIPSQTVDTAVSGGGKQSHYISDYELERSEKIRLGVTDFGTPGKVEDLQINYNKIEISGMDIFFE
jgi:hypothetical protein